MKRLLSIGFFCLLLSVQVSCQDPVQVKLAAIDTLEAELKSDPIQDQSGLARNLVDQYRAFAEDYPSHDEAPAMWFKAGEVSEGLGDYNRAIQCFEQVYSNYPEHDKAPVALFVEGFIWQDKLKETQNAQERFRHLMTAYPKHPLSAQAKAYVEVMELDDDELIELFESKEKKKGK